MCILDDASDLPRDILQFVLQERKERVFEKEPTEKHTSKERERERERERKEERDPRSKNFTYSIKMVAATLAKRAISELFTQQVRAPTVSGSAAEAKRRSIYFFRDICRVSAFSIFFPLILPRQNHSTTGLLGTSVLSSFASNDRQHKFFFVLLPAFTLTP